MKKKTHFLNTCERKNMTYDVHHLSNCGIEAHAPFVLRKISNWHTWA